MSTSLRPLITRVVIFLILFIAISGLIGSRLIPTKLFYEYNFYLYGNLGKMVILSLVMLAILIKDRLSAAKIIDWKFSNTLTIVLAVALIPVFFIFVSNPALIIASHIILITIPILLLVGVFGFTFIKNFIHLFYKQIVICFILSLFFDFAIFQVWKIWPIFSGGVLIATKWLLSLTFSKVIYTLPFTLTVNNFSVAILQACSGLDSLFMFTALYVFIGLADNKKINRKHLLLLYPIAIAGLYILNILRVYLLIIIGATISPVLALNLFHTYAGMVIFIIYFWVFWRLFQNKIFTHAKKTLG